MQRRYVLSPITVIASLVVISMLFAVACGGAESPDATGAQTAPQSGESQPAQQPTPAQPEATPTPLPASLPTEVVGKPSDQGRLPGRRSTAVSCGAEATATRLTTTSYRCPAYRTRSSR